MYENSSLGIVTTFTFSLFLSAEIVPVILISKTNVIILYAYLSFKSFVFYYFLAFIENLKGYRTLDDHLLSKDFSEDLAKAIINNLIHIHKATFFATSNSNCLEDLEAQLQ